MRSLLYLLLLFFLFFEIGLSVPIPSPPPVVHKPGDFVGVRPAAYEDKSKENVRQSHNNSILLMYNSVEESQHSSGGCDSRTLDRRNIPSCDDIQESSG